MPSSVCCGATRACTEVRARRAERGKIAADVVAEDVVLRVGVGDERQDLRVRRDDVIRLHERFLRHLPVAADALGHMHGLPAVLEPPALEVPRQHVKVLLERHGRGVHVDENEPAPRADARLGQAQIAVGDVLEIPATGNGTHAAVELPAEAMERAAEMFDVPVREQQLAAAVRAGVVQCPDRSVGLAGDQQRAADDVVDDRVTRLPATLPRDRPSARCAATCALLPGRRTPVTCSGRRRAVRCPDRAASARARNPAQAGCHGRGSPGSSRHPGGAPGGLFDTAIDPAQSAATQRSSIGCTRNPGGTRSAPMRRSSSSCQW